MMTTQKLIDGLQNHKVINSMLNGYKGQYEACPVLGANGRLCYQLSVEKEQSHVFPDSVIVDDETVPIIVRFVYEPVKFTIQKITYQINSLDFYLVRNKQGKWFRAKGYGGYGESWVDDIKKARVYTKISPARAIVTFFSKKDSDVQKFGIPEIVHFEAKETNVFDETHRQEHIKKQKEQQKQAKALAEAKRKLEEAQKHLEETKRKYARL